MTDFYHHRIKHFGYTWLEYKSCRFIGRPRRHSRIPTGLARAFSKKLIRREIESEI